VFFDNLCQTVNHQSECMWVIVHVWHLSCGGIAKMTKGVNFP